jgi:predicted permease
VYNQLVSIIAPILLVALVGYFWARSGVEFHSEFVRRLVFYVGGPCLVVSSLTRAALAPDSLLRMGLLAFSVTTVMGLLCWIWLRLTRRDPAVLLPPMIFSNNGNMGLPLCLFAFGDIGLALAVAYFVAMTLLHFTFGIMLVSRQARLADLARSPFVWAAAVAVLVIATGYRVPQWAANTLELLGQMTIPLMLLTLGFSLASLRVADLASAALYGGLRVLGGFLVATVLITALSLSGPMRGVLLIQASMPSAVFNYLMAQQYRREPETTAGVIVMSTLLSFLTMPLLVWFALG